MAVEIDLNGILNGYSREIREGLKKIQNEVADDGVSTLKSSSPNRTGKYTKTWTKKRKGSKVTIYNSRHYQLTHLLEFGHALRNGGRTKAMAHIKPVEASSINEYAQKVEALINNVK